MVAVSLLVADSIENGISTVDVDINTVFFSPQKHADIRSHRVAVFSFAFSSSVVFVVMTSWQNILDHLPTGTGRPGSQEQSKRSHESTQKPSGSSVNEITGRCCHLTMKKSSRRTLDSSRPRPAQDRKSVFPQRKRIMSAPKFNLLGLKPAEDFQPYNMGFFQPRGLSKRIARERAAR
jgi:hypothetical protein